MGTFDMVPHADKALREVSARGVPGPGGKFRMPRRSCNKKQFWSCFCDVESRGLDALPSFCKAIFAAAVKKLGTSCVLAKLVNSGQCGQFETTQIFGAEDRSACVCEEGAFWVNADDACHPCPNGMLPDSTQ